MHSFRCSFIQLWINGAFHMPVYKTALGWHAAMNGISVTERASLPSLPRLPALTGSIAGRVQVTHLFRDALRGWGRIVLSVSVSPAACDYDETARVLRYAATAAQINIVATAAAAPPRPLRAVSPNITKKHRLQAPPAEAHRSAST